MIHAFCLSFQCVAAATHTPQWPAPHRMAICQLPRETNKHPTQDCQAESVWATIPKNWRATIPISGGHQPDDWQAPYSLNLVFATKFSWSRSLVLMFFFLVARVFGLVGALEASVTAARKEPFLTDADPTSHRVRLWRGGSASNPAGACPSL